jgi:hypothetical protein
VREAYSFLATNYSPGDEIFLIGFSRGAFTARSIAGLIAQVGLLTKSGLGYLADVFKDVKHQRDPHYRPKNPNIPFPNKPSAHDPRYREELVRVRLLFVMLLFLLRGRLMWRVCIARPFTLEHPDTRNRRLGYSWYV